MAEAKSLHGLWLIVRLCCISHFFNALNHDEVDSEPFVSSRQIAVSGADGVAVRSMLGPPLLRGVARCPLHRLVQRKGRRREEGLPRAAGPIIEGHDTDAPQQHRDGATLRRTVPRS